MYQQIFLNLRASGLIRIQAYALLLSVGVDWALMPVVTKLEGTHLPVYMISLFLLLGAADGLLQPLFHKVNLAHVYLFSALLDSLQLLSYTLYFWDEKVFTYTILALFTLQSITFEVSRIHTIDFMQHAIALKDYLVLRSFVISVAILTGSLLTIGYDLAFSGDFHLLFFLLTLPGLIAIILEIRLYQKLSGTKTASELVFTNPRHKAQEHFR